ncbi:LamG domain-containing protein [Oceanidesulfovibrio marinus]|uniref:LamG domain-containing protein n=1 Tax=Oceanidesulfovibrio marinus TaxID=370038 RepID=A0ABX6NKG2_9BACT|nr:LamG domain-containing protein [Oceanidesulfovibrio marinus]QJT11059.1 LamG domain-containing protein [Oceanidesulfovibrio marinus]
MPISRDGLILELLGGLDGSNILDTSDRAEHASIVGDVEVEQDGHPLGSAFVFDGSASVDLPQNAVVTGAAPRTVALWFYRETELPAAAFETIYNAGIRQSARWFDISLGPGTVEILNYGYGEENDTIPFNYAGAWRFVCFQYDGGVKRAWIDGEKVVEKSIILDTGTGYHELAEREGNYRFHGKLARLRIWDRALSEAEVTDVFHESTASASVQRSVLTIGPDRSHRVAALGMGNARHGLNHCSVLGLNCPSRQAGGLGSAAVRASSLGLGTNMAAPPSPLVLGMQLRHVAPARLGRGVHLSHSALLDAAGTRTIARHESALTGTGRAFPVRHASRLAGASGTACRVALDLADPPTHRIAHQLRVFIDADEITSAVLECDLRQSLDSPHDEFSLQCGRGKRSIDEILDNAAPLDSAATPRLTLCIDGKAHHFLLETRGRDGRTVRLGGRSPSVLAESPYADTVTVEGGVLASEAAQILAESCGLSIFWDTHDWRLPESWIGSGPPMNSLLELTMAVGAFLRWDSARQAFAAVDASATGIGRQPAQDCTAEPLLSATEAHEQGTGCNAVTVYGFSGEIFLPRLEVEPPPEDLSGHLRGAPATVLAHWPGGRSDTAWTWSSSGTVTPLGDFLLWRRQALTPFVMGRAELNAAPAVLGRVQWIGAHGGAVRLSPGRQELLCDPGRSGIAVIDYAVRVQRFLLSDHDVSALVFLVAASAADAAGVNVIHGPGSVRREDEAIEAPLLTDRAGAVYRARSHLAWNSRPLRSLETAMPYRSAIAPGSSLLLDDGQAGIAGPCLVRATHLHARGPKLVHNLELIQWTD